MADTIDTIIVANRSLVKEKASKLKHLGRDDRKKLPVSMGGLAQAMAGLEGNILWVARSDDDARVRLPGLTLRLIESDPESYRKFYNGMCNGTLWPIFHHSSAPHFKVSRGFPKPRMKTEELLHYYLHADLFSKTILEEICENGDLMHTKGIWVWTQDYHHMLTNSYLRELLRKKLPPELVSKVRMSHFVHTPFFNVKYLQEYLSTLTSKEGDGKKREECDAMMKGFIKGMLANDQIGFHVQEYIDNFQGAVEYCIPEAGIKKDGKRLVISNVFPERFPDHKTLVGAYPIGVDSSRILAGVEDAAGNILPLEYMIKKKGLDVGGLIRNRRSKGIVVFVGIERLDYTKGIPERIMIYRRAREILKERGGDCVLVQIGALSRGEVPAYGHLIEVVDRMQRSDDSIIYTNQTINPPQNCRLMRDADAMLVTTLEDGMNLVVLESIIAKSVLPEGERGCIVVGNCGAAKHLKAKGFGWRDGIVYLDNPKMIEDSAERIVDAVENGCSISDDLVRYVKNDLDVKKWAYSVRMDTMGF